MRTNIEIDDKLMKQAMKATGATTKRAAVDAALRQLVELASEEESRLHTKQSKIGAKANGWLEQWLVTGREKGTTGTAGPRVRTNIDLDESLIARGMELRSVKTIRALVEDALVLVSRLNRQKLALKKLRGIGWDGDLKAMRSNRVPDWDQPEVKAPERRKRSAA